MKKILLAIIILFAVKVSYCQNGGVSIGKNNNPAHVKALLDLVSDSKGLLIPRMTTNKRNKLFSSGDNSAKSLLVFDKDLNSFMYWTGKEWESLATGSNTMIVDNLDSDSKIMSLSANQGKVLKEMLEVKLAEVNKVINSNIDSLAIHRLNIDKGRQDIFVLNKRVESNIESLLVHRTDIDNNRVSIDNNATLIESNRLAVNSNKDLIYTNTTDIESNRVSITSNAGLILINQAAIASNVDGLTSAEGRITANEASLAAANSNISKNASSIELNKVSIGENSVNITTNGTKIAKNSEELNGVKARITTNEQSLESLNNDIAENATTIGINKASIDSNAKNISENKAGITDNNRILIAQKVTSASLTGACLKINKTDGAALASVDLASLRDGIRSLPVAPSGKSGDIYYNTNDEKIYINDGTSWTAVDTDTHVEVVDALNNTSQDKALSANKGKELDARIRVNSFGIEQNSADIIVNNNVINENRININTKADKINVYTKDNLQKSGRASVHYNNITNKPTSLDVNRFDDVTVVNPVKGDIVYFDGSTWTRLSKGKEGEVLIVKNEIPQWDDKLSILSNIVYKSALKVGSETVEDLLNKGVTADELVDAGADLKELLDLGADEVKGGKLFYANSGTAIDAYGLLPGDGLISMKTDIDGGNGIQWYAGKYVETGATSETDGKSNTQKIIAAQGRYGSYAALLCTKCTEGGYDDWYLPSKEELILLYAKKDIIGGFSSDDYWSSNEQGNYSAWYIGNIFGIVTPTFANRNKSKRVRCIRRLLRISDFSVLRKYSVSTLKIGGYSASVLKSKGLTRDQMLTLGFSKEELLAVDYNNLEFSIGETFAGGIIFHINTKNFTDYLGVKPGHVLIAMKIDKTYSLQDRWYEALSYAGKCSEGGYTDWRLPSKGELNLMYENKDIIGGFSSNYYWSSTEHGIYHVWIQGFDNGDQITNNKQSNNCRVRCIRRF